MKNFWKGVALATLFFICPNVSPKPAKTNLVMTLRIDDRIDNAMAGRVQGFRKTAEALPAHPIVNVLIFSSGGFVASMDLIIKEMRLLRAQGHILQCLSIYAASAAFMIWMECDIRYVLPDSRLMFHYPYSHVHDDIDAIGARAIYERLTKSRAAFQEALVDKLGTYLTPVEIEKAADESKTWVGSEFCADKPAFCTVLQGANSLEGMNP